MHSADFVRGCTTAAVVEGEEDSNCGGAGGGGAACCEVWEARASSSLQLPASHAQGSMGLAGFHL